jgi:hypothetical protein
VSKPKLKTFIIEETACYYVNARTRRAAEKKFLSSITIPNDAKILCEVSEREVYPDPENRLAKEEG